MRAPFRAVVGLGISAAMLAVPSGTSLASVVVHAPRVVVPINKGSPGAGHGHGGGGGGGGPLFGWASSNWSGYAVSSGKRGSYTAITGKWTVPQVQSSGNTDTYSSSWIGIDGFNNSSLIQTGTEQDYLGDPAACPVSTSSNACYYVWWEILPQAETVITSMTVKPGDIMSAWVKQVSGTQWTISITDTSNSTSDSFTTTRTYRGPGSSAEWIEEAPSLNGQITTLADYGSTAFDPGTVNGQSPGLKTSDGGVMVQGTTIVSTPSYPDTGNPSGDGFSIEYGSSIPPTPTF